MPSLRVTSLSTEYVKTEITYKVGGAVRDPTGFPVDWAFTLPGVEPEDSEWFSGSWEASPASTKFFARALIGPDGDRTFTDGQYSAWVRVTGFPEIPVKLVGRIVIT